MAGSEEAAVEAIELNFEKPVDQTRDSSSATKNDMADNEQQDQGLIKHTLLYSILDVPPVSQCLLLGLQHFITMMSGTAILPTLLFDSLCITELSDQSAVISSTFFVMGIATLLQTVFGTRLPIIQGASAAFFVPTFAILASDSLPKCVSGEIDSIGVTENDTDLAIGAVNNTTQHQSSAVWMERVSIVGGTLAVASLFQIFLGATGLTAVMMRHIGPLVVAPTICLIGLSLVPIASASAGTNWPIALMVCLLIVVFSYALDWVHVPMPTMRDWRIHFVRFPLFKSFPVLLSVGITWSLCAILTASGALSDNPASWSFAARTDTRSLAFAKAAWFRVPYPGQFGRLRVMLAGILGMMAGAMASMVESLGDYVAAAQLSGAQPPPSHAVNRGVIMEGLACLLAGCFGLPVGSTSYSENIGAIGITRVGSRRVIQYTAFIMILLGVCPKVGATFVSLPQPIVGGLFLTMFGMVAGVGLASLHQANMSNQRNVFIVGIALALGIGVPHWLRMPPLDGQSASHADALLAAASSNAARISLETLLTLLKNEIFVAGMVAFMLDNVLKGSYKDRGLAMAVSGENSQTESGHEDDLTVYGLPFGEKFLQLHRLPVQLPFLPKYSSGSIGGQN